MTPEDIEAEFYAYQELDGGIKEEFEDDDFNLEKIFENEEDWETVIDDKL